MKNILGPIQITNNEFDLNFSKNKWVDKCDLYTIHIHCILNM